MTRGVLSRGATVLAALAALAAAAQAGPQNAGMAFPGRRIRGVETAHCFGTVYIKGGQTADDAVTIKSEGFQPTYDLDGDGILHISTPVTLKSGENYSFTMEVVLGTNNPGLEQLVARATADTYLSGKATDPSGVRVDASGSARVNVFSFNTEAHLWSTQKADKDVIIEASGMSSMNVQDIGLYTKSLTITASGMSKVSVADIFVMEPIATVQVDVSGSSNVCVHGSSFHANVANFTFSGQSSGTVSGNTGGSAKPASAVSGKVTYNSMGRVDLCGFPIGDLELTQSGMGSLTVAADKTLTGSVQSMFGQVSVNAGPGLSMQLSQGTATKMLGSCAHLPWCTSPSQVPDTQVFAGDGSCSNTGVMTGLIMSGTSSSSSSNSSPTTPKTTPKTTTKTTTNSNTPNTSSPGASPLVWVLSLALAALMA